MVIAVDPGDVRSAFVVLDEDDASVLRHGKVRNEELATCLAEWRREPAYAVLVIEMIASYGMPVGATVFETCVWIGRYLQIWNGPHVRVYRGEVKLHLCKSSRAKDANVRQALIDRCGPGRARAIGTKRAPGPLYGITADRWAALAVGVTYLDGAASRKPSERKAVRHG